MNKLFLGIAFSVMVMAELCSVSSCKKQDAPKGDEIIACEVTISGSNVTIPLPPANEIWYVSHSGKIIPLAEETPLLVSNTYSNDKGIYKFSADLTSIGGMFDYSDQCFTTRENEDFKTLILPKNISKIKQFGISHLSRATTLVLPCNLAEMGSDCLCRFGESTPETSNIFLLERLRPLL